MYYIKCSNWLGTTFTTMLQKRSNNNLTVRPFLMPESHYVKAEINKSLRNITMASTAWKTICTSMCLKPPHFYSSLRDFNFELLCSYKISTALYYGTFVIFYYSIKYEQNWPRLCTFYPTAFFDLSNLEIHLASFLKLPAN